MVFGKAPDIPSKNFWIYGVCPIAPTKRTKMGPQRRLGTYIGYESPSIIKYLEPSMGTRCITTRLIAWVQSAERATARRQLRTCECEKQECECEKQDREHPTTHWKPSTVLEDFASTNIQKQLFYEVLKDYCFLGNHNSYYIVISVLSLYYCYLLQTKHML
jgi:hypothetical protein